MNEQPDRSADEHRRSLVPFLLLLIVVVVALGLALAEYSGSDKPEALPEVAHGRRVVVFNYCGNVCAGGTHVGARFVGELAREADADSVLLQEVCRSQAQHLQAVLRDHWGDAELHYVSTYVGDLNGLNDCEGDDYGLAILAPALEGTWVEPMPNPGLGERQIDRRAMPCAVLARSSGVVCTTHLVRRANDPDAHDEQVHAFIERATALSKIHPDLVIAGDLNDDADAFAVLFDEPAGQFSLAENSSGVDHAFASRGTYREVRVTRRSCDCSDHDALVITLSERRRNRASGIS